MRHGRYRILRGRRQCYSNRGGVAWRPGSRPGAGRAPRAGGRAAPGRAGRTAAGGRKRRWFDYPRAGKGPLHRWLPSWRVVFGTVLTGIAVVVGIVAAAYLTTDIPEPGDFAQAQGTRSEERRVGKASGARWTRDQEK